MPKYAKHHKPKMESNYDIRIVLFRQIIIFLIYFSIASIPLFNRKGGGDIFFTILLFSFISLHLITLIIRIISTSHQNQKNKLSFIDIVVLTILIMLFVPNYWNYLEFVDLLTR